MDTNNFYALFSATCFVLVGLWWNAVATRPQAVKNLVMQENAMGVYFSFLIPGMIGLGAQVAGSEGSLWRWVFAVGSVVGAMMWTQLIRSFPPKEGKIGFFRRNRWIVVVLYLVILGGSIGIDNLVMSLGITPSQFEGFMMCLLVLMGHGNSWEILMAFSMEAD